MTELLTRAWHTRAESTSDENRTISGIAAPYGVRIHLWGDLYEELAPGCIEIDPDQPPKLRFEHDQIIGPIDVTDNLDDGMHIVARISATRHGDDALALVRDGVLDRFSIGFEAIEHTETTLDDGSTLITRTRILLREVSLVAWPAYPEAKLDPRSSQTTTKEETMTVPATEQLTRADLVDIERRLDALATTSTTTTPPRDNRSAGAIVRAMADGDTETIDAINGWQARAYNGFNPGTDFPDNLPSSFRDLTKLVEDASDIAPLFASAPLPDEGMTIPYLRITSQNMRIGVQENPGDDLPGPSKLTYDDQTAKIEVLGGWTELDIPRVKRLPIHVLDQLLRGMAIEAGRHLAQRFATALNNEYDRLVAANQRTYVAVPTNWKQWVPALTIAIRRFRAAGAELGGLLVDTTTFDVLAQLETTNGEPLMLAQGDRVNQTGQLNLRGHDGQLFSCPVYVNQRAKQIDSPGYWAMFFAKDALRVYKDPIVQLQDQNVVNLTQQISIYQLAAIAIEQPDLLLPVVQA